MFTRVSFVFYRVPSVFTRVLLVFIRVPSVFTHVPLVFIRVPSVFTRVPLVFIRVPSVFTRGHSCSIGVHSCSDLCGVLDMTLTQHECDEMLRRTAKIKIFGQVLFFSKANRQSSFIRSSRYGVIQSLWQ